jgi:excisionase family DNA binding protein
MAVFDRVAIDHWQREEIVQKFPKGGLGDIKLGSQAIVNPYEVAVFVRSGKAMGTLESGRHTLTTANVPFLTNLMEGALFGGKNVFTADVYYVKTADMTMRWGTSQPIIVEHPQRKPGASAIIGNGSYVIKVVDPWRFLQALDAFRDSFTFTDMKNRLDPLLAVMFQDKLSELAIARDLGPAQLQSFTQDLNNLLVGLLQPNFDALGMTLVDFNIRFNLHPESLEVVTKMGYGTSFQEMRIADAAITAAGNPSGGGMAELGIGMMGIGAMQQQQMLQQQMQQQMQQGSAAAQPAAAPQAAPAAAGATPGMADVMTPAEVATVLRVSEEDVIAAIQAGDLRARKIGNAYRVSRAALEAYLND